MAKKEDAQQIDLINYIKPNHPSLIVMSNLAGVKLPPGLAVKVAKMQTHTGMPDCVIFRGRGGYFGLGLELKRSYDKFLKLDSTFRKLSHVTKQVAMLRQLRFEGYYTDMVTLQGAIDTLEWYLRLPPTYQMPDKPLFEGRNIK